MSKKASKIFSKKTKKLKRFFSMKFSQMILFDSILIKGSGVSEKNDCSIFIFYKFCIFKFTIFCCFISIRSDFTARRFCSTERWFCFDNSCRILSLIFLCLISRRLYFFTFNSAKLHQRSIQIHSIHFSKSSSILHALIERIQLSQRRIISTSLSKNSESV